MISVVIPLYNKEKQIKRTLQSVLTQTFQDFEIVIVNDGSTDNSTIEVEKIKDSRIRLIHQENAGVSAARNKGIEEAKYELIAFLDADDEWKSKYLEVQYNLYRKYPECDIFACNYEFVNEKHDISPTIIKKLSFKENDGILNNYFEVACVSHPPLCSSAIVIKKKAIQAIGGFLIENPKQHQEESYEALVPLPPALPQGEHSRAPVQDAGSHVRPACADGGGGHHQGRYCGRRYDVHLDALRPAGADGAHRTALLLHRAVFRGARRHRHIHRAAA